MNARGMMTRDEWMAWLEESWAEAQKIASSRGDELRPTSHALEPVAYITGFYGGHCVIQPTNPAVVLSVGMALYAAPIECVRMTDEEMDEVVNRLEQEHCAIEAKLNEKNGG